MGKKKAAAANVTVGTTLPPSLYKQLERRVKQTPGATVASVLRELVTRQLEAESDAAHGDDRKRKSPAASLDEERLVRLLTHFEERLAQRVVDLNYNLRQATGFLLTPKPRATKKPPARLEIKDSQDAKKWIESYFREIDA